MSFKYNFVALFRYDAKSMVMKKAGFIFSITLLMGLFVNAQDYRTALGVRLSSSDAALNSGISLKHFFW